jgi:HSP20 family protein
VINEAEQIRVLAELPGVEKSDIKTTIAEDSLTIRVESQTRKYYKEVQLPANVDPDSSKASYNNGVLEVTLRKVRAKPKGREIKID